MRRMFGDDSVGACQICGELLTSRDILQTGQARLCSVCFDSRATDRATLMNAVHDVEHRSNSAFGRAQA
ncbi:MAG: hypothetical protein OWU33_14980 [Firmicutes bacterium]|nr:hypothetical protein [Bacillota bacterium]